jgi:hypothetical protein
MNPLWLQGNCMSKKREARGGNHRLSGKQSAPAKAPTGIYDLPESSVSLLNRRFRRSVQTGYEPYRSRRQWQKSAQMRIARPTFF